jgi:L-alanine-DL-glutamate epimerase-like enolase superfamily enzyme
MPASSPSPAQVDAHLPDGTAMSPLTVRSITCTPVRVPLAREFKGSYYRMTHRATVIVQVATDAGVVGEAYVGDEDTAAQAIVDVIRHELSPRLVGRDALATEACWAAAYPVTFDILRDRRIGLVAMAAVDTAIWDAVGKYLGQPLWRLWGGAQTELPVIAIGGYYGEPLGPLEDEVVYYRDVLGLAGMKLKVGGRSPAEDAQRVARARSAGGEDFVLCIDANQGYEVAEAVELAERTSDYSVRWFEEPVRWHNDRRALRDVRFRGRIATCAGQSEVSTSGCRDLMEAGAIDVCNFDASWSGGPTAWRRTAAVAASYDVAMAHHEEPQVSVHLLASVPSGTYVECFHPDRDPFWWKLVANRPELRNGRLPVPLGPGLGWELDRDYIEHCRLDK